MPRSTPDGLARPGSAGASAKSAPISPQPPSHAASSSRWLENHSGAAPLPKGSQCAAHRGSHSRQPDHRRAACPAPTASAAATARSAPTAHQSVPSLLKESIPPPPRFLKGVLLYKNLGDREYLKLFEYNCYLLERKWSPRKLQAGEAEGNGAWSTSRAHWTHEASEQRCLGAFARCESQ